ncbi:MAG: LCP family protein [Chloroflexi bacterium]|nr:LCP family protein [Chloroflexota bacterium]
MLERGTTGEREELAKRSPRRPSAVLAAVLSFFIPGLGQIFVGRRSRGLIIAIPQLVVIGVLIALYLRGPLVLAGLLLQYALWISIINVFLLAYRALAVIDAYRLARVDPSPPSPAKRSAGLAVGSAAGLALLLVADVALHGSAAYASYLAYDTTQAVFPDDRATDGQLPMRGRSTPAPSPDRATPTPASTPGAAAPGSPGVPEGAPPSQGPSEAPPATSGPTAVPPGTPYWAENGRLDVLLLGADEGPGRWGLRPDAIHVASVDIASGRSALIAIPRYLHHVPLPAETAGNFGCLCFPGYINAIYTYTLDRPDEWPGGENRGFRAVAGAVETFLGLSLDGIVVVNLNGFVGAVDAVGGIDITIPEGVYDEDYRAEDGISEPLVDIPAGRYHFDGHTALMYVRSRHQDGDYARLGRQQIFLRALQDELTACRVITHLPDLLGSLKDLVRTDIPLSEVPALLGLLSDVERPRRLSLTPEVGFALDQRKPGAVEMVREAARTAVEPGPDQGPQIPGQDRPPEQAGGC